jgi:polyphenol oxidase
MKQLKEIQYHPVIQPFFKNMDGQQGLSHFVSTRLGGYSTGEFASFNLALHVPDDPGIVLKNRLMLCKETGIDAGSFVFANQVHSTRIRIVTTEDCTKGFADNATAFKKTDAMITEETHVCLIILTADCVPVLLFDPVRRVIAAIHAGWRGSVNDITSKTVREMIAVFGSRPADILAGIGPSIGPCCYNVDTAFVEKLNSVNPAYNSYVLHKGNGLFFDLWKLNTDQLIRTGLRPKNIENSAICTSCNHNVFYSYRFEKGSTGRFASGIMLKS